MDMTSYINARSYRYADIMLEHASVGMAIYDAQELRLLEANRLYLALSDSLIDARWQGGKTVGHTLPEWTVGGEKSEILAIFRAVAETGLPYHGSEFVYRSIRRGLTYWNWSLEPVYDQRGEVIYLIQTVSEVTEQVLARKQAEQVGTQLTEDNRVIEAERKRLEVIETVARSVREFLSPERTGQIAIDAIWTQFQPVGVTLHAADPAQQAFRLLCLRLSTSNDAILKRMQYLPYEEAIGCGLFSTEETLVIEDLQTAAGAESPPPRYKQPQLGIHGYVCVPLWFGDYFEGVLCASFEHCIQASGPEVRALEGCGTHIAAALAHARLHSAVIRERARLRDILDQLPEGILIAEVFDGTISYANPVAAHILGTPLEKLLKVPLHQHSRSHLYRHSMLEGAQLPPWNFAIIRALCGETIKGKEALVIKPNESRAIILLSAAPLYTENGLMTGAVIAFQDITAQKSLEQQKNEFFSVANHELRTPITIIQGFAEILQFKADQSTVPLDSLTEYALTSITEQSLHLTYLIEAMLDISRIEHYQFALQRAPHNILDILTRVIESQSITTRQHTIHLTLQGLQPTDALFISIDEQRMIQVMNNLISNAIKYSPDGGDIEVGLRYIREEEPEIRIWVKDHGIGIPEDEIPHIFKRFHRARSIDPSLSGFGIGLYLAKEVVNRHGGRIWVESVEKQGSTFSISLPAILPVSP